MLVLCFHGNRGGSYSVSLRWFECSGLTYRVGGDQHEQPANRQCGSVLFSQGRFQVREVASGAESRIGASSAELFALDEATRQCGIGAENTTGFPRLTLVCVGEYAQACQGDLKSAENPGRSFSVVLAT